MKTFSFIVFCLSSLLYFNLSAQGPDKTIDKIQNYWREAEDSVTWMHIVKDSIYFVDENNIAIRYNLCGDEMTLDFGYGIIQKVKVGFSKDTLIWKSEEGIAKYLPVYQ